MLRGIFLGRPSEVEWFLTGIRLLYPDAWRRFAEFLPEAERGDLLSAYHRRLFDPRPEVHLPAARSWARYEAACSALVPDPRQLADMENDQHSLALARIEAHYFANRLFLPPQGLLAGMDRLARHPAVIVQGRYDVICPMASADLLARTWTGAEFVVVPDAGHAAMEPGIRRALVRATERLKTLVAA
jgi:proline iminopeptidase